MRGAAVGAAEPRNAGGRAPLPGARQGPPGRAGAALRRTSRPCAAGGGAADRRAAVRAEQGGAGAAGGARGRHPGAKPTPAALARSTPAARAPPCRPEGPRPPLGRALARADEAVGAGPGGVNTVADTKPAGGGAAPGHGVLFSCVRGGVPRAERAKQSGARAAPRARRGGPARRSARWPPARPRAAPPPARAWRTRRRRRRTAGIA
jgi:hypothetical protein